VLLKYVGSEGNSSSALYLKQGLEIGKGSVRNYLRRAVDAVLSLFHDIVFWPDVKLELDGEEYFTRKQSYAIAATVVCNDHKRIHYINVGWPGSVYDQRVFQNLVIYRNPGVYFSDLEYLLGDSAYTPSPLMVPAYKKVGKNIGSWTNLL